MDAHSAMGGDDPTRHHDLHYHHHHQSHSQPSRSSRRRSVHAAASSSSSRHGIPPASADLMSNLITSLSVIPQPAADGAASSSPNRLTPTATLTQHGINYSASDSFGVNYGAFDSRIDNLPLDHLAASSPVVRTTPNNPSKLAPPKIPRSSTHDGGGLRSLLSRSSRPSSRGSPGPDRSPAGPSDNTSFLVDGGARGLSSSPSSIDYDTRRHAMSGSSRTRDAVKKTSRERLGESETSRTASPEGDSHKISTASPRPIPDRNSSLRYSKSRSKRKGKAPSHARDQGPIGDVIVENRAESALDTDKPLPKRPVEEMPERSFYLGIGDDDGAIPTRSIPRRPVGSRQNSSHLVMNSDDDDDDFSAPYPSVANGPWREDQLGAERSSSRLSGSRDALKLKTSTSRLSRRSAPGPLSPLNDSLNTLEAPPRASTSAIERPGSADSIDEDVEAFLSSPRLSQKVRHAQTGRVVSFSEVGDPGGSAVFCCVGMGLTRFVMAFYDELAQTLKLRLITPDRPGVGDSEAYSDGTTTPLSWPDDVYAICQALKISKFSILAHSAGAIYALATALRMPQHIRGRIHLLAPWIPPSQMNVFGSQTTPPTNAIPTSQKILRALPTPILKAANSSFMTATSSSISSSLPKNSKRSSKRKAAATPAAAAAEAAESGPAMALGDGYKTDSLAVLRSKVAGSERPQLPRTMSASGGAAAADKERQTAYDRRLTTAIWNLATRGANPATDLLVCLERRQPIGFRYVDISRPVVIHHGSRDSRVPVDNVRWLGKAMRRCEVRVLEGEGHGLMASANVMGTVLMEVSKEWEDWMRATEQRDRGKKSLSKMF